MKITAIRAFPVWVGTRNQLIVKVEADDGILGIDDREVFPVQVQLDGAGYRVPDTPGLGVEVDEARLVRDRFRRWEAPHLRRPDGSFTNS